MKHTVVCWLTLVGLTVSAQAADLSADITAVSAPPAELSLKALKNPLPDTLTYMGVTLYGRVDLGYAAATTGAPTAGAYWGMNPQVYAAPAGRQAVSSLNTLGLSGVGLKIEENIGDGWQFVGKVQTGFDPLTLQLDDMCKTRIANNGLPGSQQTVNGLGLRCGQVVNGDGYGGVSNPAYGTLTVGRQLSLVPDFDAKYDAQSIWSFSLLQFVDPGVSAYAAYWDNSVKYNYEHGPFHTQLMFAEGSGDSGLFGNSYAGDVGVTWRGFSFDAVYTVMRDSPTSSTFGVGACGVANTPSCSTLNITATNSDVWQLLGKYTYDFAGGFINQGHDAKLTFFAGYQHAQISDPSTPLTVGATTVGGYVMGAINNTAYLYGDKNLGTAWVGAKYETGPWVAAASYYRFDQGYYKNSPTSIPCSSSAGANCSGAMYTAAASVMYIYDKHLSIYGGVAWSGLSGGLSVGYTPKQETAFLTGVILNF